MKTCLKCGNAYSEELNNCPLCNTDTELPQQTGQMKVGKKSFLKTKIFRSIIIAIVAITALSLTVYSAKYFYNKHKIRFLTEANAYLSIGDKKSAAPLLLKYLLDNPQDIEVKKLYASTLDDIGEKTKALEVYKAIWEGNKGEFDPKKKLSKFDSENIKFLGSYINRNLSDESSRAAETALANKKYDEARENYKRMSAYILAALEYMDPTDKDAGENYILIHQSQELLAKYAFSYWLEGNREKAYELGNDPWYIPDFPINTEYQYTLIEASLKGNKNSTYSKPEMDYIFAGYLNDQGTKNFEEKKWDIAIEVFDKAAMYYEKFKMGGFAAECLYNCAMAYWNKGLYQKSKSILNDIKSKYPRYNPKDVNARLVQVDSAYSNSIADGYRKEADKYFDQKDWSASRAYFRKTISKLLESGVADDSNIIGEDRFNIYVTYFNEHNFVKCKEMLVEIQQKNPKYDPELVKENLDKIELIIKY